MGFYLGWRRGGKGWWKNRGRFFPEKLPFLFPSRKPKRGKSPERVGFPRNLEGNEETAGIQAMDDPGKINPRGNGREEGALALRLSRFLRTFSTYPLTNPRVQAALSSLVGVVNGLLMKYPAIDLRFQDGLLRVQGWKFKKEHPDIAWLRQVFKDAKLSGIKISPPAEADVLLAFSRLLLENRELGKKGSSFDLMWSFPPKGVEPLPYGEAGLQGGVSRDEKSEPGSREEKKDDGEAEREIGRILEARRGLRGKANDFLQFCETNGNEAELLAEILGGFPGDPAAPPGVKAEWMERVLETAERILYAMRARPGERDCDFLGKVLEGAMARQLADSPGVGEVRGGPGLGAAARPEKRRGREGGRENPPEVMREWSFLPHGGEFDLGQGMRAEALAAGLHLLMVLPEVERVESIRGFLERLLEDPKEEEFVTLNTFLKPLRGGSRSGEPGKGVAKILEFLEEEGLKERALHASARSPQAVVVSFPNGFTDFLDFLDLGDPPSVKVFKEVCTQIGPARFQEEEDYLAGRGGLLDPERVEKILSLPCRPMLPLVRIILRNKGRQYKDRCARFLSRVGLNLKESVPFQIWEDVTTLPLDYLVQVCEAEIAGRATKRLSNFTAVLLRGYIEERSGSQDALPRRVAAVRALAAFPSPENELFLKDLVKGAGFLGIKKEPPQVREAAREALRILARKGSD